MKSERLEIIFNKKEERLWLMKKKLDNFKIF
jgi:hypothetical protein